MSFAAHTIPAGPVVVPCRYCSRLTEITETATCNRCWELESRIRRDPELAAKILQSLRQPQ